MVASAEQSQVLRLAPNVAIELEIRKGLDGPVLEFDVEDGQQWLSSMEFYNFTGRIRIHRDPSSAALSFFSASSIGQEEDEAYDGQQPQQQHKPPKRRTRPIPSEAFDPFASNSSMPLEQIHEEEFRPSFLDHDVEASMEVSSSNNAPSSRQWTRHRTTHSEPNLDDSASLFPPPNPNLAAEGLRLPSFQILHEHKSERGALESLYDEPGSSNSFFGRFAFSQQESQLSILQHSPSVATSPTTLNGDGGDELDDDSEIESLLQQQRQQTTRNGSKPFLTKEGSGVESKNSNSVVSELPHKLEKQCGGVIQSALQGAALKRSIPEHIRSRRRGLRNYESSGHSPPTPLHQLCAEPTVTLPDLLECLQDHPTAVNTKDAFGRTPLHILGDNETLITSPNGGRQTATTFCTHLMNEYPAAILAKDSEGHMPFFSIIDDWIKWASDIDKFKGSTHGSSQSYSSRAESDKYKYCYPGNSMTSSQRAQFPRVEIWEETEWCFSMLSTELDVLSRNKAMPTFRYTRSRSAMRRRGSQHNADDERTILVDALVSKVPSLFKMILLLDEDGMDSRARALEMGLFRRMLLCPHIVGKWLTDMLNHGGVPAQRAVDFLYMISNTTIDDYTGGNYGTPLPSDWDHYNALRTQVFEQVGELKGTIASLVTIGIKETERAATTSVIWEAMCTKLCRPFVLGLVLIDLVLHITLMVSFRISAGIGSSADTSIVSQSIIYTICSHYLIREASEIWAMWSVSRGALKGYLIDWWNVFGIIAVVLTIVTTYLNGHDLQARNGLNAFIVGLLWIKVLAFLKVVNKEMATFILALSQILYDIRFFMVVLAVCLFMFGDLFHLSLRGKDNGAYCYSESTESGPMQDFCSSTWESYLRVYSILLGDFELDDITTTTGTTILFIIFTLFGVIILLNVLIAIISDSYEKATLRGHTLFGRARVMFVAQNEALERFLKPRKRHSQRKSPGWWNFLKRLGRWSILSAILITAGLTEIWLVTVAVSFGGSANAENVTYFVASIFLATLLGAALWVVATFLLDEPFRWLLPDRTECVYDSVGVVNNRLVRTISGVLFGLEREKIDIVRGVNNEQTDHEWVGRISYMERAVANLIANSTRELRAELQELRAEVREQGEKRAWMDPDDSPSSSGEKKRYYRRRSRGFTFS